MPFFRHRRGAGADAGEKDRFTGRIFRALWIPAMASSLGWALSDMADAVVVGQRMGAVGLAAISLILPVYMINCLFAHGFGIGGSIRYSKLLGEGKPREAVEGFNHTLQLALAFSVVTAVLGNVFMQPLLAALGTVPADGGLYTSTEAYLRILVSATPLFYLSNILNYYLRNDDNARLAGIGSVTGNICDIVLNVVFVIFAGLGTAGAALSTLIGQVIAIGIYLPGIFGKAHILQLKVIRPALRKAFSTLREGLASSVQYLFQLIFILVCNNILIRKSSASGVAIFDMIQNTSYLILYLFEGTTRAMQPLISTYCGERNESGRRNAAKYGFLCGMAAGGVMILLIVCAPGAVCSLFGLREAADITLACGALRIFCLGAFFAGFSTLLGSYWQSCGKERQSFIIQLLRGAVILLPCTVIFSSLDIAHFWWLFPVTECGALIIWGILYRFFFHDKADEYDHKRVFSRTISAGSDEVSALIADTESFCEEWQADIKQSYYVTMTVEEICLAIIGSGFADGKGYIQVTLISVGDEFELHIRDSAVSFNPFAMQTDKVSADGDYDMNAMGMRVIKTKAKSFFYRRYGGFNTLIVKV